jgi:hypothetical protein
VFNLPKSLFRCSSNPLSGRFRGDDLRILLLKLDQLTQQTIILAVVDGGGVQNVIEIVVPLNLLAEFDGSERCPLFVFTRFHKDQNIAYGTDVVALPVWAFLL